MGMLDFFSGGESGNASNDVAREQALYAQIKTPTAQELTLPELQQYVQAGILTPAQAQAYLQQSNGYNDENIDQTGTSAMQEALGQLSSVADAGPMGTPVEQAQAAQTIQGLNNAVQGQRGAIEQSMEAKGTPAAMIQAALAGQNMGQDAQQAYHNSLDQQAAAYQAAVQALSQKANVGGALQGQQNTQANTVANAQNAMQQFNAANQQQNSQFNAANQQAANATNLQNAQNASNQNVQTSNARTAYNANLPQQVFNNQLQKTNGQAGAYQNQANLAQQQGQQNAGLFSGLLGTAGTVIGGIYGGPAGAAAGNYLGSSLGRDTSSQDYQNNATANRPYAHGGVIQNHEGCYHDGGICMDDGGMVPGKPKMPGNSLKNDTVHIMASPGEAVIPRTAVQAHPQEVQGLIAAGRTNVPRGIQPHHPHDVASVLEALKQIRMGAH